MKLLDIAGFKEIDSTSASTHLTLVHSNPAILSVIIQRVGEAIQRKKNERRPTFDPVSKAQKKTSKEERSSMPKFQTTQKVTAHQENGKASKSLDKSIKSKKPLAKALTDTMSVALRIGEDGDSIKGSFKREMTLKVVLDELLKERGIKWDKVEIRYPNPRRIMKRLYFFVFKCM